MKHALYTGVIAHKRYLPKSHAFSYPFFMYFLNLDELDNLPSLGKWFSATNWALSRFYRPDYYGNKDEQLSVAIKRKMAEITGQPVEGIVCGLLNMRTLGVYFSPVNFYYGYDKNNNLTHFLAEVSNIPWNERHQYAYFVGKEEIPSSVPKQFKVSPFNPVEQNYKWQISSPGEKLNVQLEVHDARGHIFSATLNLKRNPFTLSSVRRQLIIKPAMTVSTVTGIYWQALKIYLKKIPYVPYTKESI